MPVSWLSLLDSIVVLPRKRCPRVVLSGTAIEPAADASTTRIALLYYRLALSGFGILAYG